MKIIKKIEMPSSRQCAYFCVALLLLFITTSLIFPHNAFAAEGDPAPWDITGWLEKFIKDTTVGAVEKIFALINSATDYFSAESALAAPFNGILTRGKGGNPSTAYSTIMALWTVVKTLGLSVLAFAMLMQMIKISQRIDGSATLPVLKEIALLAIFFFLGTYLVNHSLELCTAAYDEINKLTTQITGTHVDMWKGIAINEKDIPDSVGTLIVCLIIWLIVLLVSFLGSVIALALVMARAIQLYVMAACSPIPLSLLMFDETRQMGVGFCKNFVAVCLAGTILAILITLYPALIVDILKASSTYSGGQYLVSIGSITQIIPVLACSVMYIYALVKSGAWARDILGG